MLRLIRRLFGRGTTEDENRRGLSTELAPGPSSQSGGYRTSDSYFATMSQMEAALSMRDFERATRLVRENLRQIPDWVKETRREFGSFNISSIPALQQGGTVLALVGDDEGLAEMRRVVTTVAELAPWSDEVDRHQHERHLFEAILAAVAAHPNCVQTEVKALVGEEDGHRVANVISYLEKSGKIVRTRAGHTYKLVLPGSAVPPMPPTKLIVRYHRTDRTPPTLREIDSSSLSYVPLPRAPLRWQEVQAGGVRAQIPEAEEHFEVRDADWRLAPIEKIPPAERPDPAFRQMHPSGSGLLLVDDLGKAEGLGQIEAAVLRYDGAGHLVAKAGLQHGVYRIGVHPTGCGLIALSRDCVLHAYDDHLKPIFETAMADAPEIQAIRKRFEIQDDQLKNHIRCVALSRDADRYLFTAVDEAWCVHVNGEGLWGAKLPINEGWTRVARPSGNFGTSAEVDRALNLMGLSLPMTPEDLKRRYRELAKQWHPDLNPGDAHAQEKMKALTSAAEVLTGVDANSLPRYMGATFMREMGDTKLEAGGIGFTMKIGMLVGELQAADWIYAASFAANSNSVYLAGYSGRIALVNDKGEGVRVYDIGSVPRRIVDTGDYLYLLTDTRLYVLRDDTLHALIDTFDGGDLVVAQTGFGLLEKNRLRWFREDGQFLGSVASKDPIRRVYSADVGMIVETRQWRAVVQGVPGWWKSRG